MNRQRESSSSHVLYGSLLAACLAAGVCLAPAAMGQFHDDFNTFNPDFWSVTFNNGTNDPVPCQPAWVDNPDNGTTTVTDGVLYVFPHCNRGGTKMWTACPPAVTSLPVTLHFRVRFRYEGEDDRYRAISLRMRPNEWLVWAIGTTRHHAVYGRHKLIFGEYVDDSVGVVPIPDNTWLDGYMRFYADRVETNLTDQGALDLNLIAFGDVIEEFNDHGFDFLITTHDDYTENGIDYDLIHIDGVSTQHCVPQYTCAGFQPPMADYPVTVRGKKRALPLKAVLYDTAGYEVTDLHILAPPVVNDWFESGVTEGLDVSDDALPAGLADEGNQFVYNEDGIWLFKLKAGNDLAPGTYTVFMESGDASEYVIAPTCETQFIID